VLCDKITKKYYKDKEKFMLKEILTAQNFVIYIVIINIIGFLAMYIDKQKAKRGSWRIPENTLFIITAIGGGIGTIAGMYLFRHKTKKWTFKIGLPVLLILDILIVLYFAFVI
jgi:uncharacterized membrane protein YsdA (DUF1294 family)